MATTATSIVSLPSPRSAPISETGYFLLEMPMPAGKRWSAFTPSSFACPESRVSLPPQPGLSAHFPRLACPFPRLACPLARFVCPAARLACPDDGDFLLKTEGLATVSAFLYPLPLQWWGVEERQGPLNPYRPSDESKQNSMRRRRSINRGQYPALGSRDIVSLPSQNR